MMIAREPENTGVVVSFWCSDETDVIEITRAGARDHAPASAPITPATQS
jgi:hypothetical protein